MNLLLRQGSDDRTAPLSDGRTTYGTSLLPDPALSWSSCSASAPTSEALAAATTHDPTWDGARARLQALLGLDPTVDVLFTPSGTDAATVALASIPARVTYIMVGAGELGSGTALAAAGRHFATQSASGPAIIGAPVDPGLVARTTVVPVALRDDAGRPRPDDVVAAEILAHAGPGALVQAVACSKLGAMAPSAATLAEAADRGARVVIDACQGRVSRDQLRRWLSLGYAVLFTGSKFFAGAPFSGAVLLPASWPQTPLTEAAAHLAAELVPVPRRAGLPDRAEPGLRLRWETALFEMERYYALPAAPRINLLARIGAALRSALDDLPGVVRQHALHAPGRDTLICLEIPGVSPATVEAARRQMITAPRCGVPLILGKTTQAGSAGPPILRVAVGAPTVTRLWRATDAQIGQEAHALRSELLAWAETCWA